MRIGASRGLNEGMKILFLLGWALLVGAFVSGAYENMARVQGAMGGAFLSAYDLWYTLWPGKLVVTQILVERHLHAALWEYLVVPLLSLPAWLLLGGPGVFLTWRFRPHRADDDEGDEDSLFVYDALAKAAREEEDYDRRKDDMAPDHGPFDRIDLDGGTDDRRR